jgi:large subunit ribosomal protein L29
MKDANQLRSLSSDELQQEIISMRKTQLTYRLQKANGSLERRHRIKEVRRAIARIKTIMTERAG